MRIDDRLRIGVDRIGGDALRENAAAHVENRSANWIERERPFLLALRAFDVVIVTNELDLYETTDDDERPRGEEGEELDDAAIRYVHRVAVPWRTGASPVWTGAGACPPLSTCTIARGSVG